MTRLTGILAVLAIGLHYVNAAVGDRCGYTGGLVGSCQAVSNCPAGNFVVTGACPNDPAGIKCCLSKPCTSNAGVTGACQNNPGSTCAGTFVSGKCPQLPNDVQCCVANPPLQVSFWLKSFIPLNFESVTSPWPNHPGKTMLNGLPKMLEWVPNFGGCFVTDQRDFSSDILASARMHSQADVRMTTSDYAFTQAHRCGLTVKVDCDDGSQRDSATAGTQDMNWSVTTGSADRVVLQYSGLASDPLVVGSPKIDIIGTLTVDKVGKYVEFSGKVDDFPSFEAYVSYNGGSPLRIATLGPGPGSGATSLFGGANRDFVGRVPLLI